MNGKKSIAQLNYSSFFISTHFILIGLFVLESGTWNWRKTNSICSNVNLRLTADHSKTISKRKINANFFSQTSFYRSLSTQKTINFSLCTHALTTLPFNGPTVVMCDKRISICLSARRWTLHCRSTIKIALIEN